MKKGIILLVIGVAILTAGCRKKNEVSHSARASEMYEAVDSVNIPEQEGSSSVGNANSMEQEGSNSVDTTNNMEQEGKVHLFGLPDTVTRAITKDSFESLPLIELYADHWMELNNNSKGPIYITGARVVVHDYRSLEPDSYVLFRAGDGDRFDSLLGLYSQVGPNKQSYDAYRVELDEYGWLIEESINWDPVMRQTIDANDGANIKFIVDFKDRGIYSYELIIDYEYNGKMEEASSGVMTVLYEDDFDAMSHAEREFFENSDYYLDKIY